jgi:uncharacterized membrane protein YhiD involved in acid resistance
MENINFNDLMELSKVSMVSGASLNPFLITINIAISALVGLFISLIYRAFFVGVLYQKSFSVSIIMATIVTTLVIMVISGNLILSLGMVGALSIVRFRAAIKDPLDVVYLFWAIGSGIAIGVVQYSVVVIASIVIAIVLYFVKDLSGKAKPALLVVSCERQKAFEIENLIEKTFVRHVRRSKSATMDNCELVYEVHDKGQFENALKEALLLDESADMRLLNYHGNS